MAKPRALSHIDLGTIVLDREPARLSGITRRLGRRLSFALRKLAFDEIPGESWTETYKAYSGTALKIFAEQRHRVQLLSGLGGGDDGLTDAQVEAELERIALEGLRALPEERRRELLALTRTADEPIDVEEPKA